MARPATIRNKNGRWFSEAGGSGRYYGACEEVPHAEAMRRLWEYLAASRGDVQTARSGAVEAPTASPAPSPSPALAGPPLVLTVSELRDRYLDWLSRHRSLALYREARRHLARWCEFVGGSALPSTEVTAGHLEAFQDAIRAEGHAKLYVKKHSTSVRACFNKGIKMGWLPSGLRPFAIVEPIRLDPRPLLESDLPTDAEIRVLLDHAKPDMADAISLFYHTGARTHELIEATVGDFQKKARAIVLGKHKRSRTLREPIPRTITLNPDAYAILRRRCEGRSPEDPIIPNGKGRPYTSVLIDDRFATVRRWARVRASITLYSFRHLYISELLMAGVDVLLVARMAGTSVKMIESTYAHFKRDAYTQAQARLDAERERRRRVV